MHNFEKLCRTLNEAMSLGNAPVLGIEAVTLFEDPRDLQSKVDYVFNKHKTHLGSQDKNPHLNCIGCCVIDRFKGYDLLKVLCEILKCDLKHGDCLYFSINGKLITAVVIVKSNVLSITTSIQNQDEHFKRMYEKLFDDSQIETQKKKYPNTINFYRKEIISTWRRKAKSEYRNFLTQRFAQFMKDHKWKSFKFELWNSFFGLVVAVASRISRARIFPSTRSRFPCIDHIPYAACIKFALDKDESGKVSELLGEIGYLNTSSVKKVDNRKAAKIVSTAKFLISKVIPPLNTGSEEMWSSEEVEKLAKEVKKFYSKSI